MTREELLAYCKAGVSSLASPNLQFSWVGSQMFSTINLYESSNFAKLIGAAIASNLPFHGWFMIAST
jgi:hypothetical protein